MLTGYRILLVPVVTLLAFVSLGLQMDGLLSADGILPVADTMKIAAEVLPDTHQWELPSLFWYLGADTLWPVWILGFCGALMTLHQQWFLRCTGFLAAYLSYLSFTSMGQVFFGYQWDSLLLESLFLFMLRSKVPSIWWQFALRVLLFKLLFLSGYVKWASGDVSWRQLSALNFHFLTQPLPHSLSIVAMQLPDVLLQAGVVMVFLLESILPLLLLIPGVCTRVGIILQLTLQLVIFCTGSYGWFNLLVMALLLSLLEPATDKSLKLNVSSLGSIILILCSLLQIGVQTSLISRGYFPTLHRVLEAGRINNGYGLFASMTTRRLEITVEISDNCQDFVPVRFIYKPDPGVFIPAWAGFHMPRLDWQMWFAALRGPEHAPWFQRFVEKLMQRSPPVIDLLGYVPSMDIQCVRTPIHEVHLRDDKLSYETLGSWNYILQRRSSR